MRKSLLIAVAACACAPPVAVLAQSDDRPPPLPYLLQLRPDQRVAWRAYQDEMALERVDQVEAAQETTQTNVMATPERLQRQLALLPKHEAQLRRQARATLAFYTQLSPDQRRVFDRVTRTPLPPSPMVARDGASPPPRSSLPQPPLQAPPPAM